MWTIKEQDIMLIDNGLCTGMVEMRWENWLQVACIFINSEPVTLWPRGRWSF